MTRSAIYLSLEQRCHAIIAMLWAWMYDGNGPSTNVTREELIAMQQQDISTNTSLQQAPRTTLPVFDGQWKTRAMFIHAPRQGLEGPEYMGHLMNVAAQLITKLAHKNVPNIAAVPSRQGDPKEFTS